MRATEHIVRAPADLDALAVLGALPVGVVLADRDGRVRWANSTAVELLGVSPDALLDFKITGLPARRRLRLSKTTEKLRVVSRSGQTRWLECVVQRVDGVAPLELVACLMDVTGYEARHRSEVLAGVRAPQQIDRTTGLLTRSAVMQELTVQIARSRRYRNPLSVLALRVLPPSKASAALTPFDKHRPMRVLARLLREKLRWVDVAGIWSHAELLLVLPETPLGAARHLARKLRNHLRAIDAAEPGLLADRSVVMAALEWQRCDDAATFVQRAFAALPREVSGDGVALG